MFSKFGLGAQAKALANKTVVEVGRQAKGVGMLFKDEDDTTALRTPSSAIALKKKVSPPLEFASLSELHDFAWSRGLWAEAARATFVIFSALLVSFTLLSVGLLGVADGRGIVDSLYLTAITVTMVGYGDMSPTSPWARASFCFLIIFGLVVVGFGLSFVVAYSMGQAEHAKETAKAAVRASVQALDVAAFGSLRPSDAQGADRASNDAGSSPQPRRSRVASLRGWYAAFRRTVPGKAWGLLLNFVGVTLLGASFLYLSEAERTADRGSQTGPKGLTLVDALYFSVVTACGVGYGDFFPHTQAGKGFYALFALFGTACVAAVCKGVIDLYLRDVVGESIVTAIMDSTVNVHKTDMEGDGRVTEADFVLYKLLEMQKADPVLVDRISARYRILDTSGEGGLDIGHEVPSAAQVAELKLRQKSVEAKGGCVDLMDLWGQMQKELEALDAAGHSGHGPRSFPSSHSAAAALHAQLKDSAAGRDRDRGRGASAASAVHQSSGLLERQPSSRAGEACRADRNSKDGGAQEALLATLPSGPLGYRASQGDAPAWAYEGRARVTRAKRGLGMKTLNARALRKAGALAGGLPSRGLAAGARSIPGLKLGFAVGADGTKVPVRFRSLAACHDFAWSRLLWANAAKRTGRLAALLFAAYLAVGWLLLCAPAGLGAVDSAYFLSVTLSTTGYGDISPQTQAARGMAIVLIPFGLIFLSFLVSFATATANAAPDPPPPPGKHHVVDKRPPQPPPAADAPPPPLDPAAVKFVPNLPLVGAGAGLLWGGAGTQARGGASPHRKGAPLGAIEEQAVSSWPAADKATDKGRGMRRGPESLDDVSGPKPGPNHAASAGTSGGGVARLPSHSNEGGGGQGGQGGGAGRAAHDPSPNPSTKGNAEGNTEEGSEWDDVESGVHLLPPAPEAERVWGCTTMLCGPWCGCKVECVSESPPFAAWLKDTLPGKLVMIFGRLGCVVAVGACFFWFANGPEASRLQLSLLDAIYFATVSVTTVGYGDILATTTGGKVFLTGYLLWGSVCVANVLRDITLLYVNDVVGERIVETILASTIFVHTGDIEGDGVITEADFVLFKLMELQAVDREVLDRVVARYKRLDTSGEGALDIGTEVPSAAQVAELRATKRARDAAAVLRAAAKAVEVADAEAASLGVRLRGVLGRACTHLRSYFFVASAGSVEDFGGSASLEDLWDEMRNALPKSGRRRASKSRKPSKAIDDAPLELSLAANFGSGAAAAGTSSAGEVPRWQTPGAAISADPSPGCAPWGSQGQASRAEKPPSPARKMVALPPSGPPAGPRGAPLGGPHQPSAQGTTTEAASASGSSSPSSTLSPGSTPGSTPAASDNGSTTSPHGGTQAPLGSRWGLRGGKRKGGPSEAGGPSGDVQLL